MLVSVRSPEQASRAVASFCGFPAVSGRVSFDVFAGFSVRVTTKENFRSPELPLRHLLGTVSQYLGCLKQKGNSLKRGDQRLGHLTSAQELVLTVHGCSVV